MNSAYVYSDLLWNKVLFSKKYIMKKKIYLKIKNIWTYEYLIVKSSKLQTYISQRILQ